MVNIPLFTGFLYIPCGAWFLPSTVAQRFTEHLFLVARLWVSFFTAHRFENRTLNPTRCVQKGETLQQTRATDGHIACIKESRFGESSTSSSARPVEDLDMSVRGGSWKLRGISFFEVLGKVLNIVKERRATSSWKQWSRWRTKLCRRAKDGSPAGGVQIYNFMFELKFHGLSQQHPGEIMKIRSWSPGDRWIWWKICTVFLESDPWRKKEWYVQGGPVEPRYTSY